MHLFWLAYTFLYATALWSHLGAPGASYTNPVTARLGLPIMDISHFILSAGLPLVNIPSTPTNSTPTPTLIEIVAPTPIPTAPTSTRIPVPDTILFPASPLPTARLRHRALPLCYDGLHDDSVSTTKPATRTVTGTSTDLIVDSPGLIIHHFLVTLALATILGAKLIHSPTFHAAICILGLVCLSRIFFVMRRAAFKAAASRKQVRMETSVAFRRASLISFRKVSNHSLCSCGRNSNTREVTNPEGPLFTADTPSPPPLPSISPLKKLATTGPALTKTDRLIGAFLIDRLSTLAPTSSSQLGNGEAVAVSRFLRRAATSLLLLEPNLLPSPLPETPLPLSLSRRFSACGPSKTAPPSNTHLW